MKFVQASVIADIWLARLGPHCERISIAGSVRRRAQSVKDIEIVCIPKEVEIKQTTLFNPEPPTYRRDPGFIRVFTQMQSKDFFIEKGHPIYGKYIRVRLIDERISIDIFTATKKNWGYVLAIRTGPKLYSHKVLANRWVKKGYHGENGYLTKGGQPVDVLEEENLFDLLDMPYVDPDKRFYHGT